MMFSEEVLDHFRNPRNAGELADATARVEVSNPVCGDVLQLAVRVEDGKFVQVKFLCRGCTTAIACASFLTEQISGQAVAAAGKVTASSISASLGNLAQATFHGAQLAAEALSVLLTKIQGG